MTDDGANLAPLSEWERAEALRTLELIAREFPDITRFEAEVLPRLRRLSDGQRALIFTAWEAATNPGGTRDGPLGKG